MVDSSHDAHSSVDLHTIYGCRDGVTFLCYNEECIREPF